jgi:outer membrane protein OmpU
VTLGSAGAGELSVSGGVNATLVFGEQKQGNNSGRTVGTDRDVTFSGSGELDNGTTFSVSTTTNDDLGVSASTTTITTPSMGSFTMGTSNGSASYMYDEEVPQAYEQVSDALSNTMANQIGNFMDNNHIMYTAPAMEFMGAGIQAHLGYSLQASDAGAGDGSQATYSETYGKGYEAGVTITYDGLKVGVYGAERENRTPNASSGQQIGDEFNGVW